MKLREHPAVKKLWPPKWIPFFGSTAPITGEIGVLDDVRPSKFYELCCFVLMDYRGKKYIAAFNFDDASFCRRFIDFVRGQRGKAIAKVAELEIPSG
jgi:hypothetical protein